MSDFKLLPISKRVYEKESPIFLPVSEWEFTYHSKYWLVTKLFKEGGLDLFKEMAKCYPIVDRNNDLGQPSTPGTEVPSDSVGASSDTAAPVKRKKKRKKITVPSD